MEAIALPIYNSEGKEIESIKLDKDVFDGKINPAVLHQAIVAYRSNQRLGLACVKTRGEVSGGGKKPWRQKGTGRARVGSIRSPLWRGGGVTFGPVPRDFSTRIPKQIKNAALKSSLNAKVIEKNFVILDDFKLENHKAKAAAKIFSHRLFQLSDEKKKKKAVKLLILLAKSDNNIKLALRNIDFLNLELAGDVHAYDVLSAQRLVITKEALSQITKRLKR
ncbi:MAG: 50S ribosomal protein L4 [Candidatus Omnitrophica bacterium]|nr:50S ribosomal protein L4 [Candidatus Omnitrophota bacterium]